MGNRLDVVTRPSISVPGKGTTIGGDREAAAYGKDIYRWANEQADHIRAGRFDKIDVANAVEEIQDLGQRQYDAVVSNLKVVLTHMLKWDFQRKKRSRSWVNSIGEHRDRVEYRFDVSPSLSAKRDELVTRAYKMARSRVSRETKLDIGILPVVCPYDWDAIMTRPFVLDQTDEIA